MHSECASINDDHNSHNLYSLETHLVSAVQDLVSPSLRQTLEQFPDPLTLILLAPTEGKQLLPQSGGVHGCVRRARG